jgi:O-antigen/teichoic acid export membrane protein
LRLISPKYAKRLSLIFANAANTLLLPILNISVSLLVIRFASVALWGKFVYILIIVNLTNHILMWGNKDYLLKEFSKSPGSIIGKWQSCLKTRSILLPFFIPVLFFFDFPLITKVFIFLWVFFSLVYNSFDVIIVYRQKFAFSVLMEIFVLALLIASVVVFYDSLNIDLLLMLFAASTMVKSLILIYYFRRDLFSRYLAKFNLQILMAALPFFMLGLSGMLQSKIDLYSVAYFLGEKEVGSYQVIINLLIYVQTFSNIILIPFVKNVYRLPLEKVQKISRWLFTVGVAIALPALLIIYYVLRLLYRIEISTAFLLLGALFILPIFYYLPKIYTLFKNDYQNKVVLINVFGIFANLMLNILLIPAFGMIGAIAASASAQWIMLIAYLFYERTLLKKVYVRYIVKAGG